MEEIEAKCSKVYKDEEYALNVLRKDSERKLQANGSIDQLYAEINQSGDVSSESQLTAALSESQDALAKALEKREADIELIEHEDVKLMRADSPVELPDDELETLVRMVKNEEF